jgi:hypothetical protein
MRLAILLTASLALTAGCANPPPKPINANGSVSASATVADLDLVYQDSAALATTYVATCHAAMTTPGCNEGLIARLKAASTSAKTALHAAHAAVKDFPNGGSGLATKAALKFPNRRLDRARRHEPRSKHGSRVPRSRDTAHRPDSDHYWRPIAYGGMSKDDAMNLPTHSTDAFRMLGQADAHSEAA